MIIQKTLTFETAQRDVPSLCQYSAYMLYSFATKLGMFQNDPEADAVFSRMSKCERAEHLCVALKAMDAKNGTTPAAVAAPVEQPAVPAEVPVQVAAPEPVVSSVVAAPAITGRGRKPSNAGAAAPEPTQPAAVDNVCIGMLAKLMDELQIVKANGIGVGSAVGELAKEGGVRFGVIDNRLAALEWMVSQLAEAVIGAPAADFLADAYKQMGKDC